MARQPSHAPIALATGAGVSGRGAWCCYCCCQAWCVRQGCMVLLLLLPEEWENMRCLHWL